MSCELVALDNVKKNQSYIRGKISSSQRPKKLWRVYDGSFWANAGTAERNEMFYSSRFVPIIRKEGDVVVLGVRDPLFF